MDDDGFNMRNWGYYEPSLKGHLNLQLMSSVAERGTKSFLPERDPTVMVSANGAYRHPRECVVSEAPIHTHTHTRHTDYVRDSWVYQRGQFLNMLAANPNYHPLTPETSQAHTLHMLQPPDSLKDERVDGTEEEVVQKEGGNNHLKKRKSNAAPKTPKTKKTRKGPSVTKENGSTSVQHDKTAKKNMDVVINGFDMDISSIPIPVCSCTATPQQCYRWGCGGWQSACCTTSISMHPLPMSTKRRGSRIAGRKMSLGAFKKVLEKLAAEGYNFANPIDLKTYWAKHGTNKFVTIR